MAPCSRVKMSAIFWLLVKSGFIESSQVRSDSKVGGLNPFSRMRQRMTHLEPWLDGVPDLGFDDVDGAGGVEDEEAVGLGIGEVEVASADFVEEGEVFARCDRADRRCGCGRG